MWKSLKSPLIEEINSLTMGDVRDFRNLVNAVIDDRSFQKIKGFIDSAKQDAKLNILAGGECDSSRGYFVRPTLLEANDPKARTMCEEIFGPVLTLFVYDDAKVAETLKICSETSPYALTGAILSQDRAAVMKMSEELRHSAGNFYINDKPTGAVVGQQPFGGARKSGTNDKAGSPLNLQRWMSPRTVKETFVSPKQVSYPYMDEE